MATMTIPKKITRGKDLVILPREEYEALLELRNIRREFEPTPAQKRALKRARKNRAQGKYLTIDELKYKLGFRG